MEKVLTRFMGFVRVGVGFLAGLALAACGPSNSEPSSPIKEKPVYVRPAAKPDVVECLDPKAETPAWISNGNYGVRIGRDGFGLNPDSGIPPSLGNRYYEQYGEEKIKPWLAVAPFEVRLNGRPLLPSDSSDYRQTLRLGALPNKLTTTWNTSGQRFVVETGIDGEKIWFQVSTVSSPGSELSMTFDLAGLAHRRGTVPGSEQVLVMQSAALSPSLRFYGTTGPVRIELRDKRSTVTAPIATAPLRIEVASDYFRGSNVIEPLQADIEIDGPDDDQQAIRSFLTYLRGSVPPDSERPVSPLNTSGTTYNGHVFWDADIWIFPALALIEPERARTISNYRIAKAKAAERNFKERRSWVRNAPTAEAVANFDALQYPWESSVSGLEVSPTETKQQHHITGDVVWGLDFAAALGIADAKKVIEIGRKAAKFYQFRASTIEHIPNTSEHVDINPQKLRSVLNTVSPDEHYFGDHDLYTNAIAEWTIRRFDSAEKGLPFFLPRDGRGFLNYGGDRMKGYKQAAGALAIFPLQNPAAEKEAKAFMDRFADKVSKNGPAMTESVHALIWARLGERDKAYETWRRSWMDFTNHPLMLFSEKRNKDVTYFATGAAGCLQAVLYGFLGIRIDTKVQPGAKWSIPLEGGKVLSIKPNLPDEWKAVKLKGLSILGERYMVYATQSSVKVEPIE